MSRLILTASLDQNMTLEHMVSPCRPHAKLEGTRSP